MNNKNKQDKILKNIKRFMATYDVIIVHRNQNIVAKIAKGLEKTK